MPETARQAFWKSPHHATLALLALSSGVFGGAIGAVVGFVTYVLGWVYLPDAGFFTRWREKKLREELELTRRKELGEFATQRDALLSQLTTDRRTQYNRFVETCRNIAIGQDPRAAKLEEMQWTFLRLLGIEQTLEVFLEGERRDGVPILLSEAEDEVAALEKEIKRLRESTPSAVSAREKLLESRRGRLDVLRQRALRIEEAHANAQLATAELDRLAEQAKLIRADAVAAKGAGAMSARIDATFEHLAQTNRWLSEMDQFRDQLGALPEGGMGVVSPFATPQNRTSNPFQRQSEKER
jgi:HAMP domain-containing protein